MTLERLALSTQARDLRQAFDAAFAAPPPPPAPPTVALLLVRAGGETLAIRRDEMTGFARAENIVSAPGRSPAFLGLAGLRSGLYPVWSLAILLGRPDAPADWLVLAEARSSAPCAFACEAFERVLFVPEAALASPARRDVQAGLSPAVVPWGSSLAPLVDLPALQADIWNRKESAQPRRTTL